MSSVPRDQQLYEIIKKKIYKKYPDHSAYRSGHLVKEYKKEYAEKHKDYSSPYIGKKTQKKGLSRWFAEEWKNQRGKTGYKYKNDVYRPSIRITKDTPSLMKELTEAEIKSARREKYRTGRVSRFDKNYTVKKRGGKSHNISTILPEKKRDGSIHFEDYPEFTPNLSPREIFQLGSFGGTYWRPIKSKFFDKTLRDKHKKYSTTWWKGIPESHLTSSSYDAAKNKYKVRVGTSLSYWEEKDWIHSSQPYGWVQWYCDFYEGKRGDDDERQISRWLNLAGPNGRFFRYLVTLILKKGGKWNDDNISPKIRQTLQHWAYKINEKDYKNDILRRNSE